MCRAAPEAQADSKPQTPNCAGLPLKPKGEITINVTMGIDKDGILTVTGSAEGLNIKQDISVTANKGRMSEETVQRLKKENEEYEKGGNE